jgi:hypothetical protein
MNNKKLILLGVVLTTLLVVSCIPVINATPQAVQGENPAPETLPEATNTFTPEVAPSATPDTRVIITAATGSLAIRRGPGAYYNVLGYLQDGQSAVATARDSTGEWLYIPIPAYPSQSGWVAAGTQYSTIEGDINSLEVMYVGAAEPIFIRNCTFHPMKITPLNVILAPQYDAPANSIQVPPGDYAAYDQNQEGYPQVWAMSLEEGDSVDINTDGLNNTYTCP